MAKYCEEIIVEMEGMLAIGATNKACAEAVGLNEETFYAWMKKPKFSKRIKAAKSFGQVKLLKVIADAMELNWQAAAWRLERTWPDDFGRKVQLQGDKNKPLALSISFADGIKQIGEHFKSNPELEEDILKVAEGNE